MSNPNRPMTHVEIMRKNGNFIHPTAIIGPNVELGTGNHIGPFCLIGSPAENILTWGKHIGCVIIGNNNIFAGYNAVDAGSQPDSYTSIGNGNEFSKGTNIAGDTFIPNEQFKF